MLRENQNIKSNVNEIAKHEFDQSNIKKKIIGTKATKKKSDTYKNLD